MGGGAVEWAPPPAQVRAGLGLPPGEVGRRNMAVVSCRCAVASEAEAHAARTTFHFRLLNPTVLCLHLPHSLGQNPVKKPSRDRVGHDRAAAALAEKPKVVTVPIADGIRGDVDGVGPRHRHCGAVTTPLDAAPGSRRPSTRCAATPLAGDRPRLRFQVRRPVFLTKPSNSSCVFRQKHDTLDSLENEQNQD